jgi:hypothetical protein
MLQALPMIAATLALAGPSHSVQMTSVYRVHSVPAACHAGAFDQGFVIMVPKTPAYGPNGLLRLIGGADASAARPNGERSLGCVVQAFDAP